MANFLRRCGGARVKSINGKSLAFFAFVVALLAVENSRSLAPHSAMFLSAAGSIPHPTPPAAAYDLPSVISDLRVLHPWWDLVMLTFFAIANALWQNCGMCKQKANACNKGCTTCQGGGAGPPPPPPPVRL